MEGKEPTKRPRRRGSPQYNNLLLQLLTLVNSTSDVREFATELTRLLQTGLDCDLVQLKHVEEDLMTRTKTCTRGTAPDMVRADTDENGSIENPHPLSLVDRISAQLLTAGCSEIWGTELTPYGSFCTNDLSDLLKRNQNLNRNLRQSGRRNDSQFRSLVLSPLKHGDGLPGLLLVSDSRGNRFNADSVNIIEQSAQALGRMIGEQREKIGLLNREAQLEAVINTFDGIIYMVSAENRLVFANHRLVERSGCDPIGRLCYEVLHDRKSVCPWCSKHRVLAGETVKWEVKSPKDDRWYYVVDTPLRRFDGAVFKHGVIQDITDRKQKEEALREREELLRLMIESSDDIIMMQDTKGACLYHHASPNFGPAGTFIGKYPRDLYTENQAEKIMEQLRQVIATESSVTAEYQMIWKGNSYSLLSQMSPARGQNGDIVGTVSVIRNITGLKQAELKLRASEERYRALFDGAGVGLMEEDFSEVKKHIDHLKKLGVDDISGYFRRNPGDVSRCAMMIEIKDANRAATDLYGSENKDDFISGFPRVFTDESNEAFRELLVAFGEGRTRFHADTANRTLKGELKHVSLDWYITPGDEASWSRIVCSVADITERKHAVDRINEQLLFFQTLIDTVPTPIYYKDTDSRYLGCNKAFEVYSHSKKENVVGKTVFDLMGDTLRARIHHRADCELLRFPGKKLYESSVDHSDGQKSTHINRKATFMRADGTSAGIVGVILDISEQKRAEDQLRKSQEELRNLSRHLQSVREEERKAISREIHDQLGQTLTVLQMELALLTKKVPQNMRNLTEGTKQLKKRLREAIEIVRSISARTRPEMLDDLGLTAAIEWQVMEFQKLTGMKCVLQLDQPDVEIEADLSTALFRILQEALTNVWRHAHATGIHVLLQLQDNSIVLEVSDNGKGISERQATDSTSTGLIGMRERVYPWTGLVKIEGRPNQGTTVRVAVPLMI
jgi:PAS domain S-box-containing protein